MAKSPGRPAPPSPVAFHDITPGVIQVTDLAAERCHREHGRIDGT